MLSKEKLKEYRQEYRQRIFGSLFKVWREESGYTQQKFAKLLGWTSSQNVANVIAGTGSFPVEKTRLLCKLVNNITPEEVIECLLEVERLVLKSRMYNKKF